MEALIDLLFAWLDNNSTYRTANLPPPEIVELSPRELTRQYYSDAPDLLPASGIDKRVFALYSTVDGAAGKIYVLRAAEVDGAEDYDDARENPIWREMVLHELIHHAQWQTEVMQSWPCRNVGERDAYLLGGKYLEQTGTDDPLPNRKLLARLYARC
ncbi:hypothetical protein DEA8626_00899 [Defluviimonas aquaemixtae]|uniref:Uncharacterized protein n=1 Tax=Albidovulum aquaemixtae TaxID=1542388 RepID=A0A2R8B407_9RHOB|nr:hypothetical protein [Defluviimonas aquaemixtae]SPH17381.1 hypothetical protein DEA8626_00899 [Defluviimonas aquaemixtae]